MKPAKHFNPIAKTKHVMKLKLYFFIAAQSAQVTQMDQATWAI